MYSRDTMNYSIMNEHLRKFSEWVQRCPPQVHPKLRHVPDFNILLNDQETIWKFVISHPDRALMQTAVNHLFQLGLVVSGHGLIVLILPIAEIQKAQDWSY